VWFLTLQAECHLVVLGRLATLFLVDYLMSFGECLGVLVWFGRLDVFGQIIDGIAGVFEFELDRPRFPGTRRRTAENFQGDVCS